MAGWTDESSYLKSNTEEWKKALANKGLTQEQIVHQSNLNDKVINGDNKAEQKQRIQAEQITKLNDADNTLVPEVKLWLTRKGK